MYLCVPYFSMSLKLEHYITQFNNYKLCAHSLFLFLLHFLFLLFPNTSINRGATIADFLLFQDEIFDIS